jgi:hypothetical protein
MAPQPNMLAALSSTLAMQEIVLAPGRASRAGPVGPVWSLVRG